MSNISGDSYNRQIRCPHARGLSFLIKATLYEPGGPVQADDQSLLTRDHRHRLRPWPVRGSSNVLAASAICCTIVELDSSIASSLSITIIGRERKKTGVVEHLEVFDHAGLLVNGPTGTAGLPLI